MDKEYGRQRNQMWYGVKINYHRNDDNDNDNNDNDNNDDDNDIDADDLV
jgi:hypothetical protein